MNQSARSKSKNPEILEESKLVSLVDASQNSQRSKAKPMIYISDAHSASSKHTKNSKSASIRSKSDSMNSRKQPSVRKYGLEDGDKLPSGMGRKKSSNPKIRLEDNNKFM